MIDLLNDKLNKTLRLLHNPFIMRMMEYKIDISTVDNWIQAFYYVGLGVVENELNSRVLCSNSSNLRGDGPFRDTDWGGNKKPRGG